MIVLKSLAREFDIDPHKLRALLRKKFDSPTGRRWKWDEKDPELKIVRETIRSETTCPSKTKPSTESTVE
jgi:hypothetical protein